MRDEEKLNYLEHKSILVQTKEYQEIRQLQIEKIISLANSQIDPVEIKGMLKLINHTDSWQDDFQKAIKKIKENRS